MTRLISALSFGLTLLGAPKATGAFGGTGGVIKPLHFDSCLSAPIVSTCEERAMPTRKPPWIPELMCDACGLPNTLAQPERTGGRPDSTEEESIRRALACRVRAVLPFVALDRACSHENIRIDLRRLFDVVKKSYQTASEQFEASLKQAATVLTRARQKRV